VSQEKNSPQADLAALLTNPEALRVLAFGARTVTKIVETAGPIAKVAVSMTPGLSDLSKSADLTSDIPDFDADLAEDDATDPRDDTTGSPVPPGTMLVPVEAWNRILDQLGNLHEAGQSLAEARERAARAEAVAEFQIERREIAELSASDAATDVARQKTAESAARLSETAALAAAALAEQQRLAAETETIRVTNELAARDLQAAELEAAAAQAAEVEAAKPNGWFRRWLNS
jgi:hypothetical protein